MRKIYNDAILDTIIYFFVENIRFFTYAIWIGCAMLIGYFIGPSLLKDARPTVGAICGVTVLFGLITMFISWIVICAVDFDSDIVDDICYWVRRKYNGTYKY
jgi:hypothetical protein